MGGPGIYIGVYSFRAKRCPAVLL